MALVRLKVPASRWSRAHVVAFIFGGFVVVLAGAMGIERWRGEEALRAWKAQSGECLELTALWPPPDEKARRFAPRLAQATQRLPTDLTAVSWRLNGMVPGEPGRARRGSQEPRPFAGDTNSWAQIEAAVHQARQQLAALRQLLKEAPASMGDDVLQRLDSLPDFCGTRTAAQTLRAVVIHDLHRGALDRALENLVALSSLAGIYAKEPTLVTYMVRMAIAGLSIDAYWDALQAPGWTGEQLAQMQSAAQVSPLLAEVPRVAQAERAARLASWEWFRAHSYRDWIDRHADLCRGFGVNLPASKTAVLRRDWLHWGFHPTWQFAWAAQEEAAYLRYSQAELAVIREAVDRRSWQHLHQRLTALERAYRPPAANWRFHGRLPLFDDIGLIVGSSPAAPVVPYPDYRKAWQISFKTLTLQQMVVAAIALQRHQLRHGKLPTTLRALVPEFLSALPYDFMDGQPLRYGRNHDGSFQLYSIGDDGRDDGGNPSPASLQPAAREESWNGRDWVWPRLAASGH
jgi:hypothetical protein